jgi:hypothetical protein
MKDYLHPPAGKAGLLLFEQPEATEGFQQLVSGLSLHCQSCYNGFILHLQREENSLSSPSVEIHGD